MSCHTSFGYNSLTGNCYSTAASVSPASPNHSVQFNELNQFAGDGRFVYDQTTGILDVPTVRPDTIVDQTNSDGTNGQYLKSTGTSIEWANFSSQVAGPFGSVQFNDSGDFEGNSLFTYDVATSILNVPLLTATSKVQVGTSITNPVTRLFALSQSAAFNVGNWDDNWLMAGTSPVVGAAGIGLGYNSSANYGSLCCTEPGNQFRSMRISGLDQIFYTGLSAVTERMRITVSGNVGIGTSSPSYPLDVSGSAKFTTIRDSTNSTGTAGQVLTSTGSALQWDELTPRYFFDTNATFQGTSGHRIFVSVQKKSTLYAVTVSMQRDGGIHFDLPSPGGTVGTQNIAILPVGWRPPASVDGIGYASNNNTWASQAFNWGSINIDTSGNIRMRSPTTGSPITTVQPNLEQISCSIFWLSSGTIYNSDGITR
jgi:hypothetical protein